MTTAWQKKRYGKMSEKLSCVGKTKWGTERTAQQAVTRLRRENPGAFDSTVRPYRCSRCKRWYIGHDL